MGSNSFPPKLFCFKLYAILRNSSLLTPGISTGYWKARKMPKCDLSSGDSSLIICELNLISPSVTS